MAAAGRADAAAARREQSVCALAGPSGDGRSFQVLRSEQVDSYQLGGWRAAVARCVATTGNSEIKRSVGCGTMSKRDVF